MINKLTFIPNVQTKWLRKHEGGPGDKDTGRVKEALVKQGTRWRGPLGPGPLPGRGQRTTGQRGPAAVLPTAGPGAVGGAGGAALEGVLERREEDAESAAEALQHPHHLRRKGRRGYLGAGGGRSTTSDHIVAV
jgi:hypothetical protein